MSELAAIHVGGLASDIDTEGLIATMVEARGYQLTIWEEEQTEINYDVTAWSDISTYMSDLTECLDTLRSWDTWNNKTATSSDETAVTATAGSSSAAGTYTISVTELAKSHSVCSKSYTSATTDLTTGDLTDGDQFELGGVTFTIGADEYGQTLSGKETLTSLAAKINYASSSMDDDERVTAMVVKGSSTEYYLMINREATGDTAISSADTLGSALQSLEIRSDAGPGDNYAHVLTDHADASFTLNGLAMTRSSNTGLTDVITGVTLNLLNETVTDVTLTIGRDTETVKTAITDFVEKYNALAEKLDFYGQISTSGTASTGAEVDGLGELYNDSLVSQIKNNVRRLATESKDLLGLYNGYKNSGGSGQVQVIDPSYTYNSNSGVLDCLDDLGIRTTSETNELEITDEDKLDYMLANYFDEAEQMIRGAYDSEEGYREGFATDFYRYSDSVSTSITGDIAERKSTLTDKYDDLTDKMSELTDKLEDYTQDLWEQFGEMEDAMSEMNSELTELLSQLGES